jgi:APA family basic amino acid/polyamine antiporter
MSDHKASSDVPPATPTYAARLGLFDVTMLVMGGIIGAGIFLNPSIVAQRTPSPGFLVVVWVLGGVIALSGAFVFAELGSRLPKAGGGFVYFREALGGLPAFLYGWSLLLVISSGSMAAVSVTFGRYAADLMGLGETAAPLLAVSAIVFLAVVNIFGVRPGAITQNLFTVTKILALAALIVGGLMLAPGVEVQPVVRASPDPSSVGLLAVVGAALIPVLFSYGGWQQTNYVAEEVKNPTRTLPWALVLGVSGVVVLYVLANWAYVRALGMDGLAQSSAPAADVMRRAFGPRGGTAMSLGIAASTFGFLNLIIMVTPRVYQSMAASGLFFRRMSELHPRFRTPVLAIALQATWSCILTLSGTYGQLLEYVTYVDWIFFGLAGVCLIVFRRRDKDGEAPAFQTPLYPWVPLIFIVASAYTVYSSIVSNPLNAALGTGLLLLGVPAFMYWNAKRKGSV